MLLETLRFIGIELASCSLLSILGLYVVGLFLVDGFNEPLLLQFVLACRTWSLCV